MDQEKVEKILHANHLSNVETIRNEKILEAKIAAILSALSEVCQKLGVHPSEFKQYFDSHFERKFDELLRQVEDLSPSAAATIDHRTHEDISDDEPIPPLFRET